MSRSSKKGPYIDAKLQEKIETLNRDERAAGDSHLGAGLARSSRAWLVTRSPCTTAGQHVPIFVTEQMVGHKLGEFAPTRTFRGHGKDADRRGRR